MGVASHRDSDKYLYTVYRKHPDMSLSIAVLELGVFMVNWFEIIFEKYGDLM